MEESKDIPVSETHNISFPNKGVPVQGRLQHLFVTETSGYDFMFLEEESYSVKRWHLYIVTI